MNRIPFAADASSARFEALVRPHLTHMVHHARGVLRSEDLAWDAVQDTLLSLWRQDRMPDEARGVLLSIVKPRSLTVLRSRRRRTSREQIACRLCGESHRDPLAEVSAAEAVRDLRAAIAGLPTELREVIELRLDGESDYTVIAHRLSIPLGTVRSRLHRARERLAHALARPER